GAVVLARAGTTAPGMSAAELAAVRLRLVDLFLKQGIDGVIEQTRQRVPAERAEEATRFFLEVLRMSLGELYVELLRGEGLAADAEPGPADEQFFNDALNALSAIPNYGAPFWLQLDGFEQVQASGLQITKAGGQNVVYLGFALLTAGVFVMFYTSHRRVWVWLAPEDGGTRLILAGSGNRHQEAFVQEFERLEAAVAVQTGAATLPPNPPA
ncbi:MAG TPA: cytochrome c biogenesis protein ResB, partial [Plasticicumulans sp.]|nr:cytochrome c biogenesis protein ResB [Plasticicumulans sp.]